MAASVDLKNCVTLYLKQDTPDHWSPIDFDDESMKATIDCYEIMGKNFPGVGFDCLTGPQIVMWLRDEPIEVRYLNKDGSEIFVQRDTQRDLAQLAITSVLRYLRDAGRTSRNVVSFQSRRGYHYKNPPAELSGFDAIILNPKAKDSGLYSFPQICELAFEMSPNFHQDDAISHSYAYLSEKALCIFLNNPSSETLKKIDSVLSEKLQRR